MKTIYKFPLEIKDKQTINLPSTHRILSVQNQNGHLQLWAVVDTEEPFDSTRVIRIFGTGNTDDDLDFYLGGDMEFISTVQASILVWHIFIDL